MTLRWRREIGRYPVSLYVIPPSMRYILVREMPGDADDEVIAHGRALPGMTATDILRWVADELREIADELEEADAMDIQ